MKKSLYKNIWLYIALVISLILLIFGIPMLINELYKKNSGYVTLWGAADVLEFYAVILSGIITIFALIVTICYNKKDTEKQIKFYMSQTNTPFFIIDNIHLKENSEFFSNTEDGWKKKYRINSHGSIFEIENNIIEISFKNVGSGVSLDTSYIIDHNSIKHNTYSTVNKDDLAAFSFDFKYELYNGFDNIKNTGDGNNIQEVFNQKISMQYKNTLSIKFVQDFCISATYFESNKEIVFRVSEMSSQRAKI